MRGVVVGAYAASPAWRAWDPNLEGEFLQGLGLVPDVAGLELPWVGTLHPFDEQWLLEHLPRHLRLVVTDIPHVMSRISSDPDYGLASTSDVGRREAVKDLRRLRDDIARLIDDHGWIVDGVMIHAAPDPTRACVDHLARSLDELAAWDWGEAMVVLEHCDAAAPGRVAEKGWSSLEDEIDALRRAGAGISLALNWGRSAIELRDGDRVVDHVHEAAEAGLLAALVFSGASPVANAFGPAWQDNHPPAAPDRDFPEGEASSLLTTSRIRAALVAAGDLAWLGLKYGVARPQASVSERVALVAAGVRHLQGVARNLR
jgi:hypothetical protein